MQLISIEPATSLDLRGSMEIVQGAGANGRDAVRYTLPNLSQPSSAIDRFTYRIREASGKEATGNVFVRAINFNELFVQDFEGFNDGFAEFDDGSFVSNISEDANASVKDGALELTPDELFHISAYTLPLMNLENGFEVSFRFSITTSNSPADILALNFGDPIPLRNSQTPSRFAKGLTVEIVTYPSQMYRVQVDGAEIPQGRVNTSGLADGQWSDVNVMWLPQPSPANGVLTVSIDGVEIFSQINTPNFEPKATDMLAFAARTGGLSQRVLIDDISAGGIMTNTSSEPPATQAYEHALSSNYPNPFTDLTNITFSLAKSASANLSVYDATGRLVEVLVDTFLPAGRHSVSWNAQNSGAASGMYYYRLETPDGQLTRKLVFIR